MIAGLGLWLSGLMLGSSIPLVLLGRSRSEAKFQKAMSDFWFAQYKQTSDMVKGKSAVEQAVA